MVRSLLALIVFSRIRGIVGKGLGHFLITLSSSDFFYTTDFKQYFFKRRKCPLLRGSTAVEGRLGLTVYYGRVGSDRLPPANLLIALSCM